MIGGDGAAMALDRRVPSGHHQPMVDDTEMGAADLRPGEVAAVLPGAPDAAVYFIGRIRTPWHQRQDCPKRGSLDGPVCTIEIDARWATALDGIEAHPQLQVLYWMHHARRDLLLQAPRRTDRISGTFALRSPVRPNPIASSIVRLVGREGNRLQVRGLDCLDGTPLIDIKPDRPSG
jgi:tRNA-Thr(GGU) m(6)t(6)A37 methyltransferase TsaA